MTADIERYVYTSFLGFGVADPADAMPDLTFAPTEDDALVALTFLTAPGPGKQAQHSFLLNTLMREGIVEKLTGVVVVPKSGLVLPRGLGNGGG